MRDFRNNNKALKLKILRDEIDFSYLEFFIMGRFYSNSEQFLFAEFQDAQKRMNAAFSGANQVTLATRLRLAIDMFACVLRDVDSVSARTEIVATTIDELIDLLPATVTSDIFSANSESSVGSPP